MASERLARLLGGEGRVILCSLRPQDDGTNCCSGTKLLEEEDAGGSTASMCGPLRPALKA
jgi:hypothetical protein